MKIEFNGGMNQIGGNSFLISAGNTCLLFDAGVAVTGETKAIPTSKKIDAIFLSHAHIDHYGQLSELPDNIEIYCGKTTWKLIQSSILFNEKKLLVREPNYICPYEKHTIGDLSVTAFPMDHSAPDSMAFLISDGNKRIFYTGDFRGHGRKKKCFEHLVANPPENIDVLIIEGTMLGRNEGKVLSEFMVEEQMIETLKQGKELPFFLVASSQNIDRMVSCYRAAVQSDRVLVLDIYSAWILRVHKLITPKSKTPDLSWEKIRVIARGATASQHYEVLKQEQQFFGNFTRELYAPDNLLLVEDIAKAPGRYLIKTSHIKKIVEKCGVNKFGIIYSLWPGYIQKSHDLIDMQSSPTVHFAQIHAGGHASFDELQSFIKALNPAMTIPMHTEHAELLTGVIDNVQIANAETVIDL